MTSEPNWMPWTRREAPRQTVGGAEATTIERVEAIIKQARDLGATDSAHVSFTDNRTLVVNWSEPWPQS